MIIYDISVFSCQLPSPQDLFALLFLNLASGSTMATIISDDELFMYAERAKGKVVVLTGM